MINGIKMSMLWWTFFLLLFEGSFICDTDIMIGIFQKTTIVIVIIKICEASNNVCDKLSDYPTIELNQNCWKNPNFGINTLDIPKQNGYPLEEYEVKTEDGFILRLLRIPHNGTKLDKPRIPLFLPHGFASTGIHWFVEGKVSPAFMLSNAGYDVWMLCLRGTLLSHKHSIYNERQKEYWNFSYHEMGIYDLPPVIEFIAKITGQKGRIIYLGHSMGSTIGYVYTSTLAEHAHTYLEKFITLSPVVHMTKLGTIVEALAYYEPYTRLFEKIGIYDLTSLKKQYDFLCKTRLGIIICTILASILMGGSFHNLEPKYFPILLETYPDRFSWKTARHFIQNYHSGGQFRLYDYGEEVNKNLYNMKTPPYYNISAIRVPTAIVYTVQDAYAAEDGILQLFSELTCRKTIHLISKELPYVEHCSFVFGQYLPKIYEKVIKIIDEL